MTERLNMLLVDPNHNNNYGPHLGLAYVAAASKPFAKVNTESFLLQGEVDNLTFPGFLDQERAFVDQVGKTVAKNAPDVVGITATIGSYQRALRVAEAVKSHGGNPLVVMGGPQVSILSSTNKWEFRVFEDSPHVDVIIRGEGEKTIEELLGAVQKGEGFNDIQGMSFRDGDRFVANPNRPVIKNLDELAFPDWGVFPLDDFDDVFYLSTSRGCVAKCKFCDERAIFPRYKFRSPQSVVAEMERNATEFGVTTYRFGDSSLTTNPRLAEMCDLLIENNLGVSWLAYARADQVSPELLVKLKAAGQDVIYFGVETGSQEMLDAVSKGLTLDDTKNAVRMAKEAGMKVKGSIILGIPGETEEHANATIAFVKELNLDISNWHGYTPSIQDYNAHFVAHPDSKLDLNWAGMNTDVPHHLETYAREVAGFDEAWMMDKHLRGGQFPEGTNPITGHDYSTVHARLQRAIAATKQNTHMEAVLLAERAGKVEK
jgi:anaerobic magnesium-protoporphyrin IX monomethyl ester cyclase